MGLGGAKIVELKHSFLDLVGGALHHAVCICSQCLIDTSLG